MADVVLRGVRKSYGRRTVLASLDLAIRDGECFTLLGPSGCGKTVALRLVAGFEQPEAGEIVIGGRVVSAPADDVAVPPEGRRISVVFQDDAVWPHRTVFENVAYPLRLAGLAAEAVARRVDAVLGQVNLTGLRDRRPSQLSGGQQQRVALARALAPKPQLLVLDEPLCNLDAKLREEMRFELKALQNETG